MSTVVSMSIRESACLTEVKALLPGERGKSTHDLVKPQEQARVDSLSQRHWCSEPLRDQREHSEHGLVQVMLLGPSYGAWRGHN